MLRGGCKTGLTCYRGTGYNTLNKMYIHGKKRHRGTSVSKGDIGTQLFLHMDVVEWTYSYIWTINETQRFPVA